MQTNNNLIAKNKKLKIIHIIILVIGAIFMIGSGLHTNIWFDETYTVGLVNHSFVDIAKIGAADVHPLFYYMFAKFFTLFTGNSIISLRMFSVIGMICLSLLGYTHIRKDFGEKTGIIYSFLIMFLPVTLLYSSEIRMYSWAAVLVTLTGIYAYRIIRKESNIKNWILFGLFSLLSAYTHYFAMMAIGIINIMLFAYTIKNKKYIKEFLITGISQIVLFIPRIDSILKQALRVSGGFWIKVKYPDVIFDILSFNFIGMIESKIIKAIIFIVASLLIVYIAINIIKNKKKDKNISVCIWAISIYFGVIILSLLLSFVTDIFTTRYTLPMIGLLVFAISYVCSLENKKWVLISFMSIIVILFGISTYNVYLENYDNSNKKLEDEINNVVQEGDIFIYREIGAGSVVAIKYPNNKQYYYNAYHWTVEEAYKAYAPQMETVEDLSVLDNIKGRIIVIDDGSTALYDELKEKENIETIKKPEKINMKYKNLNYTISILNKIN